MKKNILIIIVAVLIVLVTTFSIFKNNTNVETDASKFKKEYESLNNTYNESSKHDYVKVEIDNDNPIVYSNYEEVVDILKNKTGVIYFGFKECPWCRNAVPVLIDAAKELGIDKIYYYDNKDSRDQKSLDENGNIVTEKEGTDEYKNLVEILKDYLPSYDGLNDNSIKRLYYPTVVFVKDGKILSLHTSTVDSQKDPYTPLTTKQKNELKQIYMDGMNSVYDVLCDEAC